MKNILVIGSINQDITLHMNKLPKPGETVIAEDLTSSLGGKGLNQAITIARMDRDVKFIGAVGKDSKANNIIEELKKENINTSGILKSDKETGAAYIYIDSEAENSITVYPGANFEISKEHIDKNIELFDNVDYCLMQLEIPMEIIEYVIDICNEKNIEVILNPAPYNKNLTEEMISKINFYIPNETEFIQTLKVDNNVKYDLKWYHIKGLEFSKKHNLNLIVTLGVEGSLFCDGEKCIIIPSFPVKAVDTTAAGDSFIGGFTSYLSTGYSIEESLKFGSKVASITIQSFGAVNSIPYLEEIYSKE